MPKEKKEEKKIDQLKRLLETERNPEARKKLELEIAKEFQLELEIQAFAELLLDIYEWRWHEKRRKERESGSKSGEVGK